MCAKTNERTDTVFNILKIILKREEEHLSYFIGKIIS